MSVMPSETTTIELPRETGESARAYAARVRYVTMGPGRSIDKVADQNGIKTGSRPSNYLEWSRKYGWVACAEKYDQEIAFITVQEAAAAYRRDLEDHRQRYQKAGKDLHRVALGLMSTIAAQLQGQVIEGKDGRKYTIPAMKIDANAITVLSRALTTAADLEAHALRLSELLPKLSGEE